MKTYTWIVAESGTIALHCKRCGERYAPNLPIPIMLYCSLLNAFMEQHKDCPEFADDAVIAEFRSDGKAQECARVRSSLGEFFDD